MPIIEIRALTILSTSQRSVAEVFKANFAPKEDGSEDLGASFVVYKDGKEIVALTGGWQDAEKVRENQARYLEFPSLSFSRDSDQALHRGHYPDHPLGWQNGHGHELCPHRFPRARGLRCSDFEVLARIRSGRKTRCVSQGLADALWLVEAAEPTRDS
jgi:hypothetical protein